MWKKINVKNVGKKCGKNPVLTSGFSLVYHPFPSSSMCVVCFLHLSVFLALNLIFEFKDHDINQSTCNLTWI